MAKEIFTITRWPGWEWAGEIKVEIECDPLAIRPIKLGLAVRAAFKKGARLDGARLDGASLVGARLDGASLVGARLDGARLDGARLVGARLDGARLDGARLDGARLDGASLVGARLDGARLDGASLVGALIKDAKVKRLVAAIGRGDGYVFYGFEIDSGGVKIMAGCRWFTIPEFRDHVARFYPDTDKALETLWIVDAIERRARDLKVEGV